MFQGLYSLQDESKDRRIFESLEQSQAGIQQDSLEYDGTTLEQIIVNSIYY